MKKGYILALTFVLAMTTACASGSPSEESGAGSSISTSTGTSSQEASTSSEAVVEEATAETTRFYGKVTSVIGNELSVNIGIPAEDIVGALDEKEEVELPVEDEEEKDEVVTSARLTPATPAGGSEFVTGGEVESNESIVEVTYGEETQEVTVPVGIPYQDLLAKGRIDFDQIKEGNVLCIEMSGDTVSQIYFLS